MMHAELAMALLQGGAKIIQLRAKNKTPAEVLRVAREISSLKKNHDFIFIINDHASVCVEADADGVHVGQEDTPVLQVRKIVGPNKIVGLSTHSVEQARAAQNLPVDYIGLGGIFPTQTKPKGHPVLGISTLRQVVEFSRIPVVAIGGINATNFQTVLSTGVASIAIVSAINGAGDIVLETGKFTPDKSQNSYSYPNGRFQNLSCRV